MLCSCPADPIQSHCPLHPTDIERQRLTLVARHGHDSGNEERAIANLRRDDHGKAIDSGAGEGREGLGLRRFRRRHRRQGSRLATRETASRSRADLRASVSVANIVIAVVCVCIYKK